MPVTLLDVPGFEGLGRACRHFQVQFTAFGGVIRRYAAWLIAQDSGNPPGDIDLFDLTPFLSDIDLVHTGGSDLTPHILRFLYADIPFAECFRWELRSVEENEQFRQAMLTNGIIPANLMSLATNAGNGIVDPWDGSSDIEQRSYRYIRNGFYAQSPLNREGRDLEFFSTLMYFRVLFEASIPIQNFQQQPGWMNAVAVIDDARNETTIVALQDSVYLRSRLRYLLKSLIVAGRTRAEVDTLQEQSGLRRLLEYVDAYCATRDGNATGAVQGFLSEALLTQERVLVSSGRIGGDLYRLPHHMEPWAVGAAAQEVLDTLLRHLPFETGRDTPGRSLGEGQAVVLASPPLSLRPGITPSSRLNQTIVDEFLHFAIPVTTSPEVLREFGEENLAAMLALTGANAVGSYTAFFPLTAVCSLKDWGETPEANSVLLTIRMNCGAIPEIAHDLFMSWHSAYNPTVRIFVLGWIAL